MKISALVPRYPGSKRLYDFNDCGDYDSVIEPFTGSGITSLKLMSQGARSRDCLPITGTDKCSEN